MRTINIDKLLKRQEATRQRKIKKARAEALQEIDGVLNHMIKDELTYHDEILILQRMRRVAVSCAYLGPASKRTLKVYREKLETCNCFFCDGRNRYGV